MYYFKVLVGAHNGLIRGGPVRIPIQIANVEVLAPVVFNQILEGARDAVLASIASPAIAGTRLGNHEAVIAIADDVAPGARRKRCRDGVFTTIL